MGKLKIITDSGSDIKRETAEKLGIRIVPISYTFDGETYFLLVPASEGEEIDGEVFVMKLIEVNGEEMLEGIDDGEIFDKVYNIFKENNKDEFEFLD